MPEITFILDHILPLIIYRLRLILEAAMPIRSRSPTPGFTLTHDQLSQIRAWKEEDAKLQQRREELRALLSAAEILGGQQQASEVRLSNGKDHDDGPTDMTKALETIAKSSPQPLTKDEMKNKLRAQ